ncbi:MAG TPA: hypothetical protein VLG38_03290 [Gammaproteobacteria bacterium]|nr:hypothetical protein [Gammaproteobacteria bacterium]
MQGFGLFYIIKGEITDLFGTRSFTLQNDFQVRKDDPRTDEILKHIALDLQLYYEATCDGTITHRDIAGIMDDAKDMNDMVCPYDYTTMAHLVERIFRSCGKPFIPPHIKDQLNEQPQLSSTNIKSLEKHDLPTITSIAGSYAMTLHRTGSKLNQSDLTFDVPVGIADEFDLFFLKDYLKVVNETKHYIDAWATDSVEFRRPKQVVVVLSDNTVKPFIIKSVKTFNEFVSVIRPLIIRTLAHDNLKNSKLPETQANKQRQRKALSVTLPKNIEDTGKIQSQHLSNTPNSSRSKPNTSLLVFSDLQKYAKKHLLGADRYNLEYEFYGQCLSRNGLRATFHVGNHVAIYDPVSNLQQKLKVLKADLDLATHGVYGYKSMLGFTKPSNDWDGWIYDYSTLSDNLESCLADYPIDPPSELAPSESADDVYLVNMGGRYHCWFERHYREYGQAESTSTIDIAHDLQIFPEDEYYSYAVRDAIYDLRFTLNMLQAWQPDDVDFRFPSAVIAVLSNGELIKGEFTYDKDFENFALRVLPYLEATLERLESQLNAKAEQDKPAPSCTQRLCASLKM